MNWSGRRVLVTGADGFIGSHLTETLTRAGADVRAFCLYNSMGTRGWLDHSPADVRDHYEVRSGDVRDAGFVDASCEGMEIVFHLAALIAIPFSYVAPQSFVDTNVYGTLNVLEAVRRRGCARLVATSTSEVYGTPDELPIRESHPLKAQSPYSATKVAADKLCEAYYSSFETPVTVIRPFNTYGPRQSARAVIPTILMQLLNGVESVKLGSLDPRRDLTFVTDTVSGMMAAGAMPNLEGATVQLGTGRAESIGDILLTAARICGMNVQAELDDARVRPRASEVMVLQSDPTLAHTLLGWKAEVSLEEGLRRTIDWMRTNLHRFRSTEYAI